MCCVCKEREINKSVFFTHYFSCLWLDGAECTHRYARKACAGGFFRLKLFLKIKIFNFYLQKQLQS